MAYEYFDQVDVPVFVVARDAPGAWRMLHMNKAHSASTGIAQADAADRPIPAVMGESVGQQLQQNYETAHARGRPYRYRQLVALPSGQRWYDMTLTADTKNPDVLIGTALDITVQVDRAERGVMVATEREEFIALAAHDMRAPMRQIQQFTAMLREDFVDHGDGKVELIDWIEEACDHANNLTDKVVTYVVSQKILSRQEPLELERLCREVLSTVDAKKHHSLEVPALRIKTDPIVLLLLIRNLIDNALKHGRRDRLKLHIDLSELRPGLLQLTFSDNGVGFAGGFPETDLDIGSIRSGFGLRTIIRILRRRGGSLRPAPSSFGQGAGLSATFPGKLEAATPGQSLVEKLSKVASSG